jgi:hypothetical protein
MSTITPHLKIRIKDALILAMNVWVIPKSQEGEKLRIFPMQ